MLEGILKNYPGVTVGLKRLEFSGKFEPLIHHFSDLKKMIDTLKLEEEIKLDSRDTSQLQSIPPANIADKEESINKEGLANKEDPTNERISADTEASASGEALADKAVPQSPSESQEPESVSDVHTGDNKTNERKGTLKLKHTQLLYDLLNAEFQSVIDSSQDMKAKSVMTYEYLWTLFQPGHMVFTRVDGQDRVLKLQSTKYGNDRDENLVFWLTLSYVDYDGSKFGYNKMNVSISEYVGTKSIMNLAALPLDFHPQKADIMRRLTERGGKVENFAGTHYRSYNGTSAEHPPKYATTKYDRHRLEIWQLWREGKVFRQRTSHHRCSWLESVSIKTITSITISAHKLRIQIQPELQHIYHQFQ